MDAKVFLRKLWKLIWNDNSIWSWLFNAALAFVLIKFAVYPALGAILQTNHPVVAVISDSMQHQSEFDTWWSSMQTIYGRFNITRSQFETFTMSHGFSKGDIIILKGKKPQDIHVGDILVFTGSQPEPIIHRVVKTWQQGGTYYFSTKGDRNTGQRDEEREISQDRIIGTALARVPYAGYVKILFTNAIQSVIRR